jgi:hypothetical protein
MVQHLGPVHLRYPHVADQHGKPCSMNGCFMYLENGGFQGRRVGYFFSQRPARGIGKAWASGTGHARGREAQGREVPRPSSARSSCMGHALRDQARHGVGGAAGGERHDHRDRPLRIIRLGHCTIPEQGRRGGNDGELARELPASLMEGGWLCIDHRLEKRWPVQVGVSVRVPAWGPGYSFDHTASAIALPSSCVLAVPPMSGVCGPSARTVSIARRTVAPASLCPRWSSIMAPDQIWPTGFEMLRP